MPIANPYRCGGNCVFGAVTEEEKLKPCVCLVNSRDDGETLRVLYAISWMLVRFERLSIEYRKRGETIYNLKLGIKNSDGVKIVYNPNNEVYKKKEEETQTKRKAKKEAEQKAKTAKYVKEMGLKKKWQ